MPVIRKLLLLGVLLFSFAASGAETGFWVKSPAFKNDSEIPKKFTGEGADVSPPLQWGGAPKKTREYALICDDPDAPGTQAPQKEPWVHWVAYRIPGKLKGLPENATASIVLGQNSWKTLGYRGPQPPPGAGWHRYHFKLYALDTSLELPPGATKDEMLSVMKGHILAEAGWVGRFKR